MLKSYLVVVFVVVGSVEVVGIVVVFVVGTSVVVVVFGSTVTGAKVTGGSVGVSSGTAVGVNGDNVDVVDTITGRRSGTFFSLISVTGPVEIRAECKIGIIIFL